MSPFGEREFPCLPVLLLSESRTLSLARTHARHSFPAIPFHSRRFGLSRVYRSPFDYTLIH